MFSILFSTSSLQAYLAMKDGATSQKRTFCAFNLNNGDLIDNLATSFPTKAIVEMVAPTLRA